MEDHVLLNLDAYMARFVTSIEALIMGALIGIMVSGFAYLVMSVTRRKKGMTNPLP